MVSPQNLDEYSMVPMDKCNLATEHSDAATQTLATWSGRLRRLKFLPIETLR